MTETLKEQIAQWLHNEYSMGLLTWANEKHSEKKLWREDAEGLLELCVERIEGKGLLADDEILAIKKKILGALYDGHEVYLAIKNHTLETAITKAQRAADIAALEE